MISASILCPLQRTPRAKKGRRQTRISPVSQHPAPRWPAEVVENPIQAPVDVRAVMQVVIDREGQRSPSVGIGAKVIVNLVGVSVQGRVVVSHMAQRRSLNERLGSSHLDVCSHCFSDQYFPFIVAFLPDGAEDEEE